MPSEDRALLALFAAASRVPGLVPRAEAKAARLTLARWVAESQTRPPLDRVAARQLRAILCGRPDFGHAFRLDPPGAPRGTVVAFHGHGPNWRAMLSPWESLAARLGYRLIAPSFGHGNWEARGASTVIRRALADAVPGKPVVLCGYSQGGAGAARAALHSPPGARLILVCPTLEPDVLMSRRFAGLRQLSALVVWGGRDRNVTPASVARGLAIMCRQGHIVSDVCYDASAHFLLLSHDAELAGRFENFAEAAPAPPPGDTMSLSTRAPPSSE